MLAPNPSTPLLALTLGLGHALSAAGKLCLLFGAVVGFLYLPTLATSRWVLLEFEGLAQVGALLLILTAVVGAALTWRYPHTRLALARFVGGLAGSGVLLALGTVVLHPVFPFDGPLDLALDADGKLAALGGLEPLPLLAGGALALGVGYGLRRQACPPESLPPRLVDRAYARTLLGLLLTWAIAQQAMVAYVRLFHEVGLPLPPLAEPVFDHRGWASGGVVAFAAGLGFASLLLSRRYRLPRHVLTALSLAVSVAAALTTLALAMTTLHLAIRL